MTLTASFTGRGKWGKTDQPRFDVILLATVHPNPKSFILIGNPYPSSFDLCVHQFLTSRNVSGIRVFSSGTEIKAPPHKCPKA